MILDHDGVINRGSDRFIRSPDEWIALEDSLEAITELSQAGYQVVVATNQSGIGHGLSETTALNVIYEKMYKTLATYGERVDAVFFYLYIAADVCEYRKSKSGMLREVAHHFDVDLTGVPIVGDSLYDLRAGVEVGAVSRLVLTGKSTKTRDAGDLPPDAQIHEDLRAFVHALLSPASQDTPTCVP